MTGRPILVLRPQPGNEATASAIEARGGRAVRFPLFDVRPVEWESPDPAAHDALILTSANSIRHGGDRLKELVGLPVRAVGHATAEIARDAGFDIVWEGNGGIDALIPAARDAGITRALHLTGCDHRDLPSEIVSDTQAVYVSEPVSIRLEQLSLFRDCVVMIHSARAGAVLDALPGLNRSRIDVAAISDSAARACGVDWNSISVSPVPRDGDMIELALSLAD